MPDEIRPGSRLIRNSVFNLINNLLGLASSWIISIWVARSLGPENYGIFSLTLWATGVVSWIIGLGLIHAITKFVSEHKAKGDDAAANGIVAFIMRIEVAVSIGLTLVLCALATPIADWFFSPKESFFFILAFLGLLPGAVTAVFSASIEGLQKFGYFTLANLVITPFSFGAKVAALLLNTGITGQLVVMLVFSVVNCVFYAWVLKREGMHFSLFSPGPEKSLKKRIGAYNRSVMTVTLVDKIVWDKSENFFLGRLCSATEIAYYNLGFNLAQRFTTVLPSTFWRVLFPAMSAYFGSGDEQKMKRLFFLATRYLAFVAFPVAVGGALLAWDVLSGLYGHDYTGAKPILQIMFLISIATSLAQPGAAILYGYERQSFIYKLGAIMAVVNITLDIVLIPRYGAIGAAICYAITTVVGTTIGTTWTCRTMKLPFPVASIAKISTATIIMAIVIEFILERFTGWQGALVAAGAGTGVYLVCSLVISSFEEEDYRLLASVKAVLPRRIAPVVDGITGIISQFKQK